MANKNTPKLLENAFADERDQEFNLEIHNLLNDASDAIDTDGALESINAALPIVDRIRAKLIQERDQRTGGNVVGIRSKQQATEAQPAIGGQCLDIVKLHSTIEEMDMHSQRAFDRIGTLARVSRKAIEKLVDELPVSAERAFLFDLDRTLEMIRDIADETENDINGEAEKVGCNYVDS